jgi:hypothetical protein
VVPLRGDDAPDTFDDAKRPRPAEKAVATGEGTSECERQNEPPIPTLQGIHDHHEGEDENAVNRDCAHGSTLERAISYRAGAPGISAKRVEIFNLLNTRLAN